MRGRLRKIKVAGPLGRPVSAVYGLVHGSGRNGKIAVIEMAQACGLSMVPIEKRDPLRTTTLGVGELIRNALDRGCDKIVVGVGDSATIDCGMGALSGLGIKFLDHEKNPIPLNAVGLHKLDRIDVSDLDARVRKARWIICCDVNNRLTGPRGALMFAPQKGPGRVMMGEIGRGLMNFRRIILRQTGLDVDKISGSGAAGGFPSGMAAVLKARFVSGFDLFRKVSSLDKKLKECDLVITGEGRFDAQSMRGKAVYRLIELARVRRKPVICIVGSLSGDLKKKKSLRGVDFRDRIMIISKSYL
jgi:glycerate kinase